MAPFMCIEIPVSQELLFINFSHENSAVTRNSQAGYNSQKKRGEIIIMKRVPFLFIVATLVFVTGCAKSVSQTTANGKFHVKMTFSDDTLKMGRNELRLKITDEKGAKVQGAEVVVMPTMPEHRMGSMFPPTVTDEGGGTYKVVMPLTMAGHWAVQVKIARGTDEGAATFDFPNVRK